MDEILIKYTNHASRFAIVDGTMVHYRDEGSGYPVVLLHGAFSSLHTFDDWTRLLKADFRIIRYDLPAFGLTGVHAAADYSMRSHIRLLRQLMDTLGIDRFVLGGSSLGGWIAWEFALRHPERVRKLILLDAAGFLDAESIPLAFKMARAPFAGRVVRMVVRRNILEQFIKEVYADADKITPELVDRYYELFSREGNPDAFLQMVNRTPFMDNTPQLPNVRPPTLIIWGEQDRWIPVANAHRFLNAIPRARLVIYEGIGHLPMEETPEDTMQEVWRFIHGGREQSDLFY
jgi:pimeloyl-ACP methyl ester carboxylesterase